MNEGKLGSRSLKVLAAVAANEEIEAPLLFLGDEDFRRIISRYSVDPNLQNAAKRQLGELILSLPADDLLNPLGVAFLQLSMRRGNLAGELVSALSTKWLRFGPPVIQKYESLLISDADNEPVFQGFFMQYPQFLDPMAVQVWSRPDFHGALEPDFVIRRADNSYLIVEIECPAKSIMTLRNHLTADVTHAERQATDYKSFLTDRIQEAQSHFPHFRDPDCVVVIGMEAKLLETQSRALRSVNASRHKLRIVGFDWLGERARVVISNMSSGEIEVLSGHRVV